jgi:hypothetical protein
LNLKNFLYFFIQAQNIVLPSESFDRTIFASNIKRFDVTNNCFVYQRKNRLNKEYRLLGKKVLKKNRKIPEYVDPEDVLFEHNGPISYRRKGNKMQGLIDWCEVDGVKFLP